MELRRGEFLVVKSQRCHWSTLAFVQAQLWIPEPRWEFVALRRNWILVAVLVHTTLPNHKGSQCGWERWCPQVQVWWLQNVNYWECYELVPNLEFRTSVVQWQYLRFHVQDPVLTPGQGMCAQVSLLHAET